MSRAEVAQLVEHSTENAGVVSSILSLGTLHTIENASSSFATRLRRFLFSERLVRRVQQSPDVSCKFRLVSPNLWKLLIISSSLWQLLSKLLSTHIALRQFCGPFIVYPGNLVSIGLNSLVCSPITDAKRQRVLNVSPKDAYRLLISCAKSQLHSQPKHPSYS